MVMAKEVAFGSLPKTEQSIRQRSLEQIFGKLKKSSHGQHKTKFAGKGDELLPDLRPYQFGDKQEQIAFNESLKNAQINHGIDDLRLTENDLEVREAEFKTLTSTVFDDRHFAFHDPIW